MLAASVFLPFLPMEALQILLLNMVYDLACTALPWDQVDEEELRRPAVWDAGSVEKFMFRMGPVSSVFDILTYLLLYFVVCPAACGGGYRVLDRRAGPLSRPCSRLAGSWNPCGPRPWSSM